MSVAEQRGEIVFHGELVAGWLVGAGNVCHCAALCGVVWLGAMAEGEVVETVPVVDDGGVVGLVRQA